MVYFLPVRVYYPENRVMKVTSKGRVTIPLGIRQQLGILPNCEVDFIQENGYAILRKKTTTPIRGRQLVEMLRGKGNVKMTTDQILALTRS